MVDVEGGGTVVVGGGGKADLRRHISSSRKGLESCKLRGHVILESNVGIVELVERFL